MQQSNSRKRVISGGDTDFYGLGSFLPSGDLVSDVGDLIEIDRTLYTDWALYEGDGYIIHVSGAKGENIPTNCKGVVRRDKLRDVAGHNGVRVNNKEVKAKSRNLQPCPVEDVLRKARDMIGQVVDYDLLTRNAEHFTTEWKYGVGWSDQATMAINVIKSLDCKRDRGQQLLQSLTAILQTPPNLEKFSHLVVRDHRSRRSSSTPPVLGLTPNSVCPVIPGPVIPKYSSSRPNSGRTTPQGWHVFARGGKNRGFYLEKTGRQKLVFAAVFSTWFFPGKNRVAKTFFSRFFPFYVEITN